MPVLTREQADKAREMLSSLRKVQVVGYQRCEADVIYDWNVGRSFKIVDPTLPSLKGHTSAFLCIEDCHDTWRPFDLVEVLSPYGDHIVTIELAKSYRIKEWYEETNDDKQEDQSKVPPSRYTIDSRLPAAIYATKETLAPRSKQVEPLYSPANVKAHHPHSTATSSFKFVGGRKTLVL